MPSVGDNARIVTATKADPDAMPSTKAPTLCLAAKAVATAALILNTSALGAVQPSTDSPVQLLKNHAFAACLSDGLAGSDAAKDAAAAAREYFEHGSLPIEAHTEAVHLARKYLAKDYKNIYGDNLVVMKCIDFFNSGELGRLVLKYAPKK